MAGASSGWVKSPRGAKGRAFISAAAIRMRYPDSPVAAVKARLRSDPDGMAAEIDELIAASTQPAGQAKSKRVAIPSRAAIPQQPEARVAAAEAEILAYIAQDLAWKRKDKYERKRIANISSMGADEVAAMALNTLSEAAANSDVAIRVPGNVIGAILDGGFLNQHSTGTSSAFMNPVMRTQWEGYAFGIPEGSPPEDYPVYGYLSWIGGGSESGSVAMYGDTKIIFRNSVRARTTITSSDSLGAISMPAPIDTPRLASITPQSAAAIASAVTNGKTTPQIMRDRGYFEAQIHGKLGASDIAKILFPSSSPPSAEMQARLTSLGIAWDLNI